MKTYVITLSKNFMATHPRAGEPTGFKDKLVAKEKIHTIRANYPYWLERISKVQEGKACLSIRQWTGKPYKSSQVEIMRLTKDDGVGIERLTFSYTFTSETPNVNGNRVCPILLANNDGLSYEDWKHWFSGLHLNPMAIIHFTPFRYDKKGGANG